MLANFFTFIISKHAQISNLFKSVWDLLKHQWQAKSWLVGLLISVSILFIIIIIALQQRNTWQADATRSDFKQQANHWQAFLQQELLTAQHSLKQLNDYLAVLKTTSLTRSEKKQLKKRKLPASKIKVIYFLEKLLKQNLQRHPHQLSHYFALEPSLAKKYFAKKTFMLRVQKNISKINSSQYNDVNFINTELFFNKNYLYNQRDSWYHQNKRNEKIQMIVANHNDTKIKVISVTQGIYEHHQFKGSIGINISIDSLLNRLEKVRIHQTGGLLLVNHNSGMVLTKTDHSTHKNSDENSLLGQYQRFEYNLHQHKNSQLWHNLLTYNAKNILIKGNGPNSKLYRITSRRLADLPWTLLVYEAIENPKHQAEQLLIISFIIWLSSLLIIAILYHYHHLPLQKLSASIQLQDDLFFNLSRPLPVTTMYEVKQLALALQMQLKQINQQHQNHDNLYQASQLQVKDYQQQLQKKSQILIQRQLTFIILQEQTEQYKRLLRQAKNKIKTRKIATEQMRAYIQKLKIHVQRSKAQENHARQAKTQFLANMNLELRTPMNAIIGYTEIIQEDAEYLGYDTLLPDLQKIYGASYHLLELINNLFDLARLEQKQVQLYLEIFDITPMLQDIKASIQPLLIQHNNHLKLAVSDPLGTMYSDQTKLRQNLLNILNNACKYAQDSQISLSAKRIHEQGIDWIYFYVTDLGIGMSQQQLKDLNQLFQNKATERYKNDHIAGTGLTLSHQFCQLMGGQISVKSTAQQGTEFIMKIPTSIKLS